MQFSIYKDNTTNNKITIILYYHFTCLLALPIYGIEPCYTFINQTAFIVSLCVFVYHNYWYYRLMFENIIAENQSPGNFCSLLLKYVVSTNYIDFFFNKAFKYFTMRKNMVIVLFIITMTT